MSILKVDTIQEKTSGNGVLIPGHVAQVKQGSLNNVAAGSASFSDLGSLSITPKASTSKVLVLFEQHIYVTEISANSWRGGSVRLLRDTTEIYGDPADGYGENFLLEGNIDRYMTYSTRQYLDSPSTTSSVTYKVQGNSKGGLTPIYYNTYGAGGRITLMEIAQ
tara:strand:- start:856 stop:1347 length:492 start_codon:yes stop_codon:yes gene_type:complete